jgi:NADPH:quinone reductase-like Zn-dependent oxidoreductase
MRAAVIEEEGDGDNRVQVREVPEPPAPAPGSVLLRVRAAGINPLDWQRARRGVPFAWPSRRPRILGLDVAGEVEAVGPEVTRFAPGDAVYGLCAPALGGSFAERTTARESALAIKPSSLSFTEAAALPLAGLTALQALRDRGELAAGERVLINGAAGGVGHLAVQIAAVFQARVTAVAGARDLDFVRSLGAREVIDPEEEDFAGRDDAWDVILDAAGDHTFSDCEASLTGDGGIYVTTRVDPRTLLNVLFSSVGSWFGQKRRARWITARPNGDDLTLLARLTDQGRLRPAIQDSFPLERVGQALEVGAEGGVRGKLVLRIAEETVAGAGEFARLLPGDESPG